MRGKRFVDRARAAIGIPFRPQGRCPSTGLDCLGLAAVAYDLPKPELPDDYRLRGSYNGQRLREGLATRFRRVTLPNRRVGDLLLLRPGLDQFHLGILTDNGIVHADARIGAVVETPGQPAWPICAVFRRRLHDRRN